MGFSKWGSEVHLKGHSYLQWDLVHRGSQNWGPCSGPCISGENSLAAFLEGRALLPSFPPSHPPCRLAQSARKSKFSLVTGTLDMIGKQINQDLFLHVRDEWDLTDHLVQLPFYSKR